MSKSTQSILVILSAIFIGLFSGCSLIVSNKLEEKNKTPDGGGTSNDKHIFPSSDGLNELKEDTLYHSDGKLPQSDGLVIIPDEVTGEKGNHGPFTIGEQIHIKLTRPNESVAAFIGIDDGTEKNVMVCPGQVEGNDYVCTIPPLTIDGSVIYQIYNGKVNPEVIQSGPIKVRRLIGAGGEDVPNAQLFDADTLERVGEFPLFSQNTEESPIISPSGRYLLFSFQDQNNQRRLGIADLVLKISLGLPLPFSPGPIDTASFEPEYEIITVKLDKVGWDSVLVPIYKPERAIWFTNGDGTLHRIDLPPLPTTIQETFEFPVTKTNTKNVKRAFWITDYRSPQDKWMAGLANRNDDEAEPSLFAYVPQRNIDTLHFAPDPPPGKILHLVAAQGEQKTEVSQKVLSKEAALVVYSENQQTSDVTKVLTIYRWDIGILNKSYSLIAKDMMFDQDFRPEKLIFMPYTNLVGFAFSSSSISEYLYGQLTYKIVDGFALELINDNRVFIDPGEPVAGLPTYFNPITRRMMVVSGSEMSIFESLQGVYLKFTLPATSDNDRVTPVHHPRKERFYVGNRTKLIGLDYTQNKITQETPCPNLGPLAGKLEGMIIQP